MRHRYPRALGLPLEDVRLRQPLGVHAERDAVARGQEVRLRQIRAETVVEVVAEGIPLERTADRAAETRVQRLADPDLAHRSGDCETTRASTEAPAHPFHPAAKAIHRPEP